MTLSFLLATLVACQGIPVADAFAANAARPSANTARPSANIKAAAAGPQEGRPQQQPVGNVLILDHLNINHERGRHDLLRSFYFDFLKCAVDPRKGENLAKGAGTLWANVGAQQFHLPEGRPDAQVLDGVVTLSYPSVDPLLERYGDESIRGTLRGTAFDLLEEAADGNGGGGGERALLVTDPWGSKFRLVEASDPDAERDPRGAQGGDPSEGIALRDLMVHVPAGCNLGGIARFYDRVLGAPILPCDNESSRCVVSVGPRQTLTFTVHPDGRGAGEVSHVDMVDGERVEGKPHFLSNYGPHISMYVADLRSAYRRARELGATYVNPRFKRRAYDEEEAVDDCMFRCIDIIDPEDVKAGPILRLEHEVRSVVKRDGSKYKSCPFREIPEGCTL